jgi:hypothetical protein
LIWWFLPAIDQWFVNHILLLSPISEW